MEAMMEEETCSSSPSSSSKSTLPTCDSSPEEMELQKDYGSMNLEELVTVVLVSSPMFTHPCTSITEQAINSLSCVEGLDQCQVLIILDGYHIRDVPRTKRGQITLEMR